MRIVAASGAACSAPGGDKGCDPSLLHCSLTTSVNPCCTGLSALSDPNKNLSGTLPCFATLISPLNLGLGQVRMLLVSLATEMRMTFTLYFSVKKHLDELWSTHRNICGQELFWWTCIQIFLPCHVSCDHFGIIWIVPEYYSTISKKYLGGPCFNLAGDMQCLPDA